MEHDRSIRFGVARNIARPKARAMVTSGDAAIESAATISRDLGVASIVTGSLKGVEHSPVATIV